MIVVISGYNASGKTTLTRELVKRLEHNKIRCKWLYFEKLYPSTYITKRGTKCAAPAKDGTLSLRKLEGQQGTWDRPFRWYHFGNVLAAAVVVQGLRILFSRRVMVLDRYFYDRFVHFDADGILYRLARRLVPRPSLTFVLLPNSQEWTRRILRRASDRFGLKTSRLSDTDQNELQNVQRKYKRFAEEDGFVVIIDSSTPTSTDAVWHMLLRVLSEGQCKGLSSP